MTFPEVTYVCQTYVVAPGSRGQPGALKLDRQFQFKTAAEAEDRARRAFDAAE